jgi:hypothetical protein
MTLDSWYVGRSDTDIAMLGGLAWMYSLPTYESLRLINVGELIPASRCSCLNHAVLLFSKSPSTLCGGPIIVQILNSTHWLILPYRWAG